MACGRDMGANLQHTGIWEKERGEGAKGGTVPLTKWPEEDGQKGRRNITE